jgi:phosphoserine phosphatase
MRYKMVVFDMDGTLTRHVSSWQLVHEKLGLWDEDACRYQEQFLQGKISYKKFCELDAIRWQGIPARKIEKILHAIPYTRNAVKSVRQMKTLGLKPAIISTGLDILANKVKKELGIDYCLSNKLFVRRGRLTGKVKIAVSHGEKGKMFRKLVKQAGIKPQEAIFVGDSATDVPAARAAGYAIAFNTSNRELARSADYVCKTRDFREVFREIKRLMAG